MIKWYGLLMALLLPQCIHTEQYNKACVTVFIHGAVFSGLSLVSLDSVLRDAIDKNSLYARLVKHIRGNQLWQQDQILLGMGLEHIPSSIIESFNTKQIVEEQEKKAAYHTIPAYHCIKKTIAKEPASYFYYTFGHLGLLSQQCRKQAANELYNELSAIVIDLKKKYESVEIHIIAHSHGGNIALNLVDSERKYNRGVVVDTLLLLGTPIQIENAQNAYTDFFKLVVNCYSEGDYIQTKDIFSTKKRKSYQKFIDIVPLLPTTKNMHDKKVWDIRLLANNNAKKIDHANMWLLGKFLSATKSLTPLPVVILCPLVIKMVEELRVQDVSSLLDLNIIDQANLLRCELQQYKKNYTYTTSPDLLSTIHEINQIVQVHWHPDFHSYFVVFNKKCAQVLIDALSFLMKKKSNA